MTCDEARRAFSDLYDGALSGTPLVALDRHLEGCPACRAEWDAFLKTVQALGDLRWAEPSPGFTARVRGRLEAPTPWQRVVHALFLPLRVKVPLQAVALVLMGFTAVMIFQRSPQLRRQAVHPAAPGPTARLATPPPLSVPSQPQKTVMEEPKGTFPPAAPAPAASALPTPRATGGPQQDGRQGLGGRPAIPAPRAEPPVAGEPPALLRGAPPRPSGAPAPAAAPLSQEIRSADKTTGPDAQELRRTADESKGPEGDAVVAARKLRAAPAPPGDTRAKVAEPMTAPTPAAPVPPAALKTEAPSQPAEGHIASIPSGSADELYSTGLTEFARQDYGQAVETFRVFIAQHPRDPRAPDARFWLADAYFAQQRYAEAIPEYEALVRQYPDSRRVPAAVLKQAQARLATGDRTGCAILRDMVDRYPRAREAAQAREVLGARCP